MIVSGERRYRAAVAAGLPTLLCIESRGELSPDDILEDQLVENCVREDLKPIEQARAFRTLLDRRGWSHRQLAESLHIAAGSVARALALLDLPAAVQSAVEGGELPASTAYAIAALDDPAEQAEVAGLAVAGGMSRDEVVKTVRARSSPSKAKSRGGKPKKLTERSFRVASGPRVVVEFKRGLDASTIRTALAEAMAQLDAERADVAA
jgi:ParB family chromosome partitioning protein